MPDRITRKALTHWGNAFGVKRKWFGLEPNYFYRKRIIKIIGRKG